MDALPPTTEIPWADLHRLVDSLALPIGRWDRQARLSFCNRHYEAWAGRPREQLLGRTLAQLYGDTAWAAARNAFAAAFAGREAFYERRLTHQGAAARWARVRVFPGTGPDGRVDEVYTLAVDIHDDVVAREVLEAARQRALRYADNLPYPITYVDRDFVLRFVNRAYVEMTGQSAAQLLGRGIGEARGQARWLEHRPYFERAAAGEAVQYTRLVDRPPQGPRWLRTSYMPDPDEDGVVQGVYTVTVDVHELASAQERLRHRVEHDELTGALARRTLMDRLDAVVAAGASEPVALCFIDLDGFKQVNDTLGHAQGDLLLQGVARALQAAVRTQDAVARFGGDEFIVLAQVRDAAGAQVLVQHLLAAVREACAMVPAPLPVSASIGYALCPADATQPLRLLQLADQALYAAKSAGKDRAMRAAAA